MKKTQDLILEVVPDAVIEENKYLTVKVEPKDLHGLAKMLKNNEETFFDYLIQLNGVDVDESLGVVYFLSSSKYTNSFLVLKTFTTDRENPQLFSVTDLWKTANFNEREVYTFFGIRFINHPDMRRLFLRDSWQGYPFRKDYTEETYQNTLSLESKEDSDRLTRLTFENNEIIEVEEDIFEKEEYVVNIG